MSLPNFGIFLAGYQLRLGIPGPPHFPDEGAAVEQQGEICRGLD